MNKTTPTGTVEVFSDLEALSQAIAAQFARLAYPAVEQRGVFRVCLSGGSTPVRFFHLLAETPYQASLPWKNIFFFWGDERLVPPDDDGSNFGQVRQILFSQVAVPPENLYRIKGELPPDEAVRDIARVLAAQAGFGLGWPRMDLVLLGLGEDGHTASLFPGSDPAAGEGQAALAVTGSYQGRPAGRVTLTPGVFNAARQVFFLVAGAEKAEALAGSLHGQDDPTRWPAQRIRPAQGNVTWLVDQAAAAKIA